MRPRSPQRSNTILRNTYGDMTNKKTAQPVQCGDVTSRNANERA